MCLLKVYSAVLFNAALLGVSCVQALSSKKHCRKTTFYQAFGLGIKSVRGFQSKGP